MWVEAFHSIFKNKNYLDKKVKQQGGKIRNDSWNKYVKHILKVHNVDNIEWLLFYFIQFWKHAFNCIDTIV